MIDQSARPPGRHDLRCQRGVIGLRDEQEIGRAASGIGLEVRAAVHTGEIELEGGNVRGAAMHIASRIADLAGPGEVYASWATRELLVGSPIGFTDRGLRELKGLSEGRRVYLVQPSS